ncbi:predicted protein [Naegleria gruberi]|uniref:Predicted protein n=1 Tax=Naegleria gruberi TaxID=5762 RepID=D2VBG7_NAEGR|nr:uncharacterized protein NAEGRDRAFT_48197 [Naegleria gruberi]EFC45793.1 predicted protein [Naegleria gruberi]|eukprot:XP_002678537.1 predicted protein [Naegleria gruberi strain NEG-M]
MESQPKKRKFNNSENDSVKIILSDNDPPNEMHLPMMNHLLSGLKKQLRGSKVKKFVTDFLPTNSILISDPNFNFNYWSVMMIVYCCSMGQLFVGKDDCIYVFNLQSGLMERTISLNREDFEEFRSFQVDDEGEHIYLFRKHLLTKKKLDDSLTLVWNVDIVSPNSKLRHEYDMYYYRSKNEIYMYRQDFRNNRMDIRVINAKDGSIKRNMTIEFDSRLYFVDVASKSTKMFCDEKEEQLYFVVRVGLFDNDEVSDEHWIAIWDEKSNKVSLIEIDYEIDFIATPADATYFVCYSDMIGYVYDKKTNSLLISFPPISDPILHFENCSQTFFLSDTSSVPNSIRVEKLEISTSIIDTPLKNETCKEIERLGKLPLIIHQNKNGELPDCVIYLTSIEFVDCKL